MSDRALSAVRSEDPGRRAKPIGVFTTDTALEVRTWDAWLADATGIPAESACGRPLLELVPDLTDRGLLASFEQVLARGVVEILAPAFHRYLIDCPAPGPSPTLDRMQQRVTIGPLREDGRVVGTMVAIEDVTARVERERELAAELRSLDPEVRLRAAALLSGDEPVGGTDPLVDLIGDDNWRVRRAAVKALTRRNTADVIAAALRALRDDHRNFSVLSSTIEILAASEVDVVEPLLELLGHPDPDLRLQAALALGERGDARAVPALIAATAEPDDNLRFHAIEALGKLRAIAAAEVLTTIAESGDFFLAFPALEALGQIGDPGVAPRLAPLMTDDLLRGAVAATLGRIGDEDVAEPLTRLLDDARAPSDVVAEALASVYDRYEERYRDGERIALLVRRAISPTGTQSLLDAVQSATGDRLRSIAKVLGWLEGAAVERALTRLLGNPSVRGRVVEYLVRHGERVVDLLIEQLGAEDLDTRQAAVVGLGRIGDRRATPALLDGLAGDPALILVTATALARIGDPLALEALLEVIGHSDAAVRQAAVAALNSIGHPEMAGRILPLLRDLRPEVRESAVRIAGYFGYRECADDLVQCCSDVDPAVRRAAIEHLPFLDDSRAVPLLIAALEHPDPVMRSAAAQALARVEDPRTADPLLQATWDRDSWVRYFAARALGEQGRAAAADDLARLALNDPAGHVRLAALDALGSLALPASIPALASIVESQDPERAKAAIRALGAMRHAGAWEPLQAALRAEDEGRRAAAVLSIAHLGDPRAIALLEWTAAADASRTVAESALGGLAALAADDSLGPVAARALVGLAGDPARRDLVVAALATLPAAAIDQVAERGLEDPRPSVRTAILEAFGRARCHQASRWLEAALSDPHAEVRLAALNELRHLGTQGVERSLVMLARTDPDPAIQRAALAILKAPPEGPLSARPARDPASAARRERPR